MFNRLLLAEAVIIPFCVENISNRELFAPNVLNGVQFALPVASVTRI